MKSVWYRKLVVLALLLITFAWQGVSQTTWYTLASGDWDDADIWTLDPAGAVPVGSAVPSSGDHVIILSGKTVTVPDGVAPYDSPLRDETLNCGVVTIYGSLDLRTSSGHVLSELKGNGRLLMAADNYPTITDDSDFITLGEGEGTAVYYGNSFAVSSSNTFCNLEVDMTSGQTVSLANDLSLNGNLVVTSGIMRINNGGVTALNITISGDVTIETNGNVTVSSGAAFHWLNVYGDFVNEGSIDFSNSAQYAEATDGAVKLKFLGATDNVFQCNGTTDLYRLFVDKGSDKTFKINVTADNSSNFSLYGPVTGVTSDASDGASGWQRAPVVIENGTLELGSNIIVSRMAENLNGTAPNEFSIPETARLWINGATVTTGQAGTSTQDNDNGLSLYGQLKVSSGSFTCPQYSAGISYYTPVSSLAVLEIEGGSLNVPQIVQIDAGATFVYRQSGGNVNVNVASEQIWLHPTFEIPESNSVYEMTGGSIVFSMFNGFWDGDFKVQVSSDNYNVTGGTIEIQTTSTDFEINATVPFYNLTTAQGTGANQVFNSNANGVEVLNDLTIGSGTTFNDGGDDLSIGGDFNIAGTFTQSGNLVFNGAQDGTINNTTGSTVSLPGLWIYKDRHTTPGQFYKMSLTGSDNIEIDGNLKLTRGALDVVDFNAQVTDSIIIIDGDLTSSGAGGLELTGTTRQYIKGAFAKEQEFGRLILNNTSASPQIQLVSDVNITSVSFSRNQVLNTDIYNLEISEADFASWGWATTSNYAFQTAGNSSDGGLTLPVDLTENYASETLVQLFPVQTSTGYSPVGVFASGDFSSVNDNGKITIKPVNTYHPTVKDQGDVVEYYWKASHANFTTADENNLRYRMYSPAPIAANMNASMVFADNAWNDSGGSESNETINYPFSTYISGDFTQGKTSAFNAPRILYSRQDGSFNTKNTWSETSHSGSATNKAPESYDVCIVGGTIGVNHTVTIDANNADASQVEILGNSDLGNSGTPPTLYMESGTTGHDINLIKGNGRLVYENNLDWEANYEHINGDHSELCNSSEAIIEYVSTSGAGPHVIPFDTDVPYYPNLVVSETTGTTQTTNSMDLIVKGDLTITSGTFFLDGNWSEYVSVAGDVIVNAGTLTYECLGTRYMEVEGGITFTGSGTFDATGGTDNNLYLKGDISVGSGTLDFSSGDLVVYFLGDINSTYSTGGNIAEYYRTVVAKSSGYKVHFISDFNLNGSASGAEKALHLVSGECHLDHTDINLTVNDATGGNDFKIPSGTILRIDNGADVSIAGSSTGVLVSDSLIIDNGGRLLANAGTDNYIQFDAGGSAYIEVNNSGVLNVGGQISRKTTTDEGILTFVQNGGTVTIGSENASLGTRGMFEILGTGSSFTQAAGDVITIQRTNGSATIPSLYFTPESVSFGSGAGFTFDGTSVSSETFGIYANQSLNDFTISGGTGNSAKLLTVGHTLDGNLSIGAGTTFNANGLDLTLNGNFTNNGTFSANNNATYFTGTTDQTITGNTTFSDLVKQTGGGTLILGASTTVTVSDDLTLSSGSLNTSTNNLIVQGDVTNNVTTASSGASQGIVLAGSDVQQIGGGSYAILSINNANGVVLPTQSGSVLFTDKLRLVDGIFDIGRNLLEFGESASIEEVNPFSSSNMIQTNLSFTDNGIKKTFPVIAVSTAFTYPIGSLGKYTPVIFDITANGNNTGSIRVKAADEPHVSVPVADQGDVLQYNWTLDADGISDFSATANMYSNDGDALGDTAQYITARILLVSTDWNKFTTDDFHGQASADDQSVFTFSATDDAGIDGDYTAGLSTAIPDQVPAFITVTDGDYSTTTTWATYDPDTETIGTPGVDVPAGGPRGSIIYIDHTLSFPDNFEAAYRSYINATGIVNVGTSIGHRLGDVFGTGTLKLQSGDLPAGSYDSFFSSSGGTLEYAGSANYDVLSEIPTVNSVAFTGTGDRILPNIDVQLYNDLTIDGPDVTNTYDSNLSIQGDVIFTAGTFDAGINNSTVTFNGSSLQTISGATEFNTGGGGAFYNLKINNSSGLKLSQNVEVGNDLYLTNGVIQTSNTELLTISNTATDAIVGGSSTSFVEGPLQKQILNSNSFSFPLGYSSTYGPIDVSVDASSGGLWESEYLGINPLSYTARPMDPETITAPVQYVSHNEFWRVEAPVASYNAQLTLYWDTHSGVNPDANFTLVDWQTTAPSWEQVGTGTPSGDTNSGSVSTSGNITFNEWSSEGNYITFGSITIPAYTWEGDVSVDWFTAGNWSGGIVPSSGSDVTVVTGSSFNAEIDGTAQMNNLDITSGTLTIKPGSNVTVNGDFTGIDNGLIVENSNTLPSSLINYGTATPIVNYSWSLDELWYWYIGHSVTGVVMNDYDVSFVTPNDYYLYEYTTAWSNISKSGSYLFDTPLKGYALMIKDAGSVLSYSGVLNTSASYNMTNMAAQWHLVANPYPSYIDVKDAGVDLGSFLQSTWIATDIGVGERGFATYNILTGVGQNGGERYIAPGQSMWLRTYTTNDAITIPSSARVHSSGSLKSNSIEEDVVRVTLQSDYSMDEAVIVSRVYGLDVMTIYDSEKKLSGSKVANLYSLKDGSKAAINTLPTLSQQIVVPLGYQVSEEGISEFVLKVNNIDYFVPETSVYLVDKELGKTINLREEQEYTFTPKTTQSDDRFELVFDIGVSTDIDHPDISKSGINIYANNQVAYIQFTDELMNTNGKVELYDIRGMLIKQVEMNNSKMEINLPKANNIYIVKVMMGNGIYHQKIESF